jgi:hypothetical protein
MLRVPGSDAGRRFTIAVLVERGSAERVMATERLPMRHIREVLRLKWRLQRSHRETARSLGISPGAVASVITRASGIGLTWDALEGLTDDALEQRLYGPKIPGRAARPLPDVSAHLKPRKSAPPSS